MDKYQKLQQMELNFQEINGSASNLWVYDMLGFIYAHMTEEQATELLARSERTLWEHKQYQNAKQELDYEVGAGK